MNSSLDRSGPSAEEQLMMLREMTRTTGIIHDAQALQLKLWPLVACPHAKSSEVELDFKKHKIEFSLTLTKGAKPPKEMRKRLDGLASSVQWLLGEEWIVRVRAGKKYLYG